MKEMIEDAYANLHVLWPIFANATFVLREEEDEETMEWEQEQLRRGGHRASSVQPTAVKQEYRPAPSTLYHSSWHVVRCQLSFVM